MSLIINAISKIRRWKQVDGWYVDPQSGNRVILGDGVCIGDGVRIGDEVFLGDGVRLGNGRPFICISDKYLCYVIPYPNDIYIKMGCEEYPVQEWKKKALRKKLAGKYENPKDVCWIKSTGEKILNVLIDAAKIYDQE